MDIAQTYCLSSNAALTLKFKIANEYTGLSIAARHPDRLDILQILLSHEKNAITENREQQHRLDEALRTACDAGNVGSVKMLLEAKADPNSAPEGILLLDSFFHSLES